MQIPNRTGWDTGASYDGFVSKNEAILFDVSNLVWGTGAQLGQLRTKVAHDLFNRYYEEDALVARLLSGARESGSRMTIFFPAK